LSTYLAIWLSGYLAIWLSSYTKDQKSQPLQIFFLKHIPDADNPFTKQYKYNF